MTFSNPISDILIYSGDPLVHDPLVHEIAYSTVFDWLPFSGGRIVHYTIESLVARPCTTEKNSSGETVHYRKTVQ
jgi:hypothetical protein